ncbi:MAG TPA: EAL domain-containing protein [Coleofasciculaceae cyanobacterium]
MLLETLHSQESKNQAQAETFEISQLELWYQPIYQTKTGEVLHNEVLLRWRDEQGNLHLPEEFFKTLSRAGILQQADRTVIRKATELLAHQPDRYLSINLSGEGLHDFSLIEFIATTLDQAGVDPKQLSFELTEFAIARDFTTAQAFTSELKNLGCSVVLDNFASRELTLFQCQQLDADLVKVDGQLIQRLKTDPESRMLTKAILQAVKSMSPVTAKFVTDAVTLDFVREVGLDYIQGYHLKPPSPEPDWTSLVKPSETVALPVVDAQKPPLAGRLIRGASFLLLGLGATAIGIGSIGYRMIHVTVGDAILNGRIVGLQAPTDGKIEAFYAKPGVEVKSGQVLARIGLEPDSKEERELLQLERSQQEAQIRTQRENSQMQGEVQLKSVQFQAAKESLAFLNNQLHSLDSQQQAVRSMTVKLASESVSRERAGVEAAIAKATAARSEYQRYQQLVGQGAVSKLQTEKARSAWESAEAEVKLAQANLRSTQTTLDASKKSVAVDAESDYLDQRIKLLQAIHEQKEFLSKLEAEVATSKQQLNQIQALYSNHPSLASTDKTPKRDRQVQQIQAPMSGVIYKTEREQGDLVTRSQPMLTLLDCNDLWVEAVVNGEVAKRIDPKQPVRVRLADSSETVMGEIDLMQPIDRNQGLTEHNKFSQDRALLPSISPKIQGQLLTLITVRIPPLPDQTKSQNFCGIGQAAQLTFSKKGLAKR